MPPSLAIELIQSAHRLANGELWLPTQTTRHELDRWFLKAVLGITSEDVHAAVGRLREKLCTEPSIHGGKKSRCDLEAEVRKFG